DLPDLAILLASFGTICENGRRLSAADAARTVWYAPSLRSSDQRIGGPPVAFAKKLLRAIVVTAGKFGVKKLAYAGGAQVGMGTIAESAAEFSIQLLEDVVKSLASSRDTEARVPALAPLDRATQQEIRTQIAEAAQATGEQMAAQMSATID